MKSITETSMNFIATLIAALMCFGQTTACTPGNIGELPKEKLKATFELPKDWHFIVEDPPIARSSQKTHDGNFSNVGLTLHGVIPGTEEEAKWWAKKAFEEQWEIKQIDVPEPQYLEREIGDEMVYASLDSSINFGTGPHWRTILYFEKNGHMVNVSIDDHIDYVKEPLEMLIKTVKWQKVLAE